MGTNHYYTYNVCACCGRSDEKHIGKSSLGWNYALHVYPDENIFNLEDWIKFMDNTDGAIRNEYGDVVSKSDLNDVITKRSHPHGLSSHPIDNTYCIGNGAGTYDYLIGDFS